MKCLFEWLVWPVALVEVADGSRARRERAVGSREQRIKGWLSYLVLWDRINSYHLKQVYQGCPLFLQTWLLLFWTSTVRPCSNICWTSENNSMVLCLFVLVPSIPARMLAMHFLFNLMTFFTFNSNLFLIVLPWRRRTTYIKDCL